MTTYAASVTIVDLPPGTTVSGTELFEAVQTTSGVAQSVQLTLSQMLALGGLPVGGGTGAILNKSSASNYSTQFSAINTFVNVNSTTGLSTSGTITSIVIAISSGGIGSTQIASGAVQQANLTAGAVGSSQLGAFAVVASAIATGAIGSTQLGAAAVGSAQIAATTIVLGNIATGVVGMTLLNTLLPNAIASVSDTTSMTANWRDYMITFENVVAVNSSVFFQAQLATSGSNFISGSYVSLAQVNVSSIIVTDTSTTALILSGLRATTTMGSSTIYGLNGFIKLFNPAGSVNRKSMVGEVMYLTQGASGTTILAMSNVWGLFDSNSNPTTGINFSVSAGNIATGVIRIYGMA